MKLVLLFNTNLARNEHQPQSDNPFWEFAGRRQVATLLLQVYWYSKFSIGLSSNDCH